MKDFYCEWCGSTFKSKFKKNGKLPNCPFCLKKRYKEDKEKYLDGHANKDVHLKKEWFLINGYEN